MTKTQVEVITSVQRRRRWSRAEKERIVAAAMEPGAIASEVARAAGIHSSQLFRWRQQLCERVQIPAAPRHYEPSNCQRIASWAAVTLACPQDGKQPAVTRPGVRCWMFGRSLVFEGRGR